VHFSTVLQSIVFSEFLGVLVTDLSVGAPLAAEVPPCVFRFSVKLSVVWTWKARGVQLVRKLVTRQRFALGQPAGTNYIFVITLFEPRIFFFLLHSEL